MNNKEIEIYQKTCKKLLTKYGKDGLCELLNISKNTIKSLLNGYRIFTIEHAIRIQIATNNKIKAYHVRPDLHFLKKIEII